MTSFLGCIPEQMRELNDLILERTEQIRDLLEGLGVLSGAVGWTGPDAEAFRDRTGAVIARGGATAAMLLRRGQELAAQAEAQDAASAPDRGAVPGAEGPGPRGSALPEILMGPTSPGGPAGGPPPASGTGTWQETLRDRGGIGQPLAATPQELERLREAGTAALEDLRTPRPGVPAEEGGLRYDEDILAGAEGFRTLALRKVPGLGLLQGANIGHGKIETALEDAESWLIAHGHEEWVPALDLASMPVTVGGALVGDESVLGQSLRGIDQTLANRVQTTGAVGSELLEGDLGGAARELEYGMLRDIENASLLLVPDPTRAVLGAGEELLHDMADASEPIAPAPVSEQIHAMADGVGGFKDQMEEARGLLTDPQELLRRRREHLPLPWDPAPAQG
ncbi:hypothetical protein [Brachybacterium phenoliresistens]|uniref:hypothetical protein n=1 Tax=Brachybacterium phenoliresistens TaxID=396014 RepID=UPI0031D1410C